MWVTALLPMRYCGDSMSPHYSLVGPATSGNSTYHPRSSGKGPGLGGQTLELSEEGAAKARMVPVGGILPPPRALSPGQMIMVRS